MIPAHIKKGDEEMNLLFLANLKKNCPERIDAETPKEKREAKVYVNWTNSLT